MKPINKLVLIDDDEIFVYITSKIIEQTKMVNEINVFENGSEALRFLSKNALNEELLPDLILLDLSMPIMDGWQFLEECAKMTPQIIKKIPIYICSSSISRADIKKANNINLVSEYIIKPIAKEKILEIITRCTNKQKN